MHSRRLSHSALLPDAKLSIYAVHFASGLSGNNWPYVRQSAAHLARFVFQRTLMLLRNRTLIQAFALAVSVLPRLHSLPDLFLLCQDHILVHDTSAAAYNPACIFLIK